MFIDTFKIYIDELFQMLLGKMREQYSAKQGIHISAHRSEGRNKATKCYIAIA